MSTIVQKFGGTSVGSVDQIKLMANRILQEKNKGHDVVVVVSAMGKTTDTLLQLAGEISSNPCNRELDMLLSTGEQVTISLLAMALKQQGAESISLTGRQAGIHTDTVMGNAQIVFIDTERIRSELEKQKIVVVAGFQGVNENGDISTLGRGGSDTTAAALAAYLNADRCDIFTDVDGVYTTDPGIVGSAVKIPSLSYEEMLSLAAMGAGVLHPRAIRYAERHQIPIAVKSSARPGSGTMITNKMSGEKSLPVTGIAFEEKVSRLILSGLSKMEASRKQIISSLSALHIQADIYLQLYDQSIILLVKESDTQNVLCLLNKEKEKIGYTALQQKNGLSKVSVIGSGLSEIKAEMCRIFIHNKNKVKLIGESSICVTALLDRSELHTAVRQLHTGFGLDFTLEKAVV
ncbi:aspartate kinase [Jeotgalibacillus sp. S-D1]|uniref:aspartate kinase n=1 Tax=Jeotgalibacillus sp. S-D1 TaxID=2552189 RepID=UPI001059BC7A|nr:aspartate kinase [Jeotgalibacillus sp. S-D1]TDL34187.1 aspartate kinase [Jeotgalibacillus sp. S-D1]